MIDFSDLDPRHYDPDKFIRDIEGLLVEICRQTLHGHYNSETLQIARLAALEAVETFDSKKGMKISTWIYKLVQANLYSYLLSEFYRNKAKFRNSFLGLHAYIQDEETPDKSSYFIDHNAPQPYDDLQENEYKSTMKEIINAYMHNGYNKEANTKKLLMAYFVHNVSTEDMTKKFGAYSKGRGKRYDNRLKNFVGWMTKYCQQNNIKPRHLLDKKHAERIRDTVHKKLYQRRNNIVNSILRKNKYENL